ncbi:MAG TPA: stage III sporulation protein AD [Tissierellia bacterium]|nr:stage III sporulation protein AD [Tissierellia bacterium]
MDIVQIVGIGIISTILIILLRQSNKAEFALLVSAITGMIIFSMVIDKMRYVIETLSSLARNVNMEFTYFSTILKIIGIAYIVEFGAQISRDAGENAIASKIELGGKVIMMVLAMPIILALLDLIMKVLP